jgi:hypothetical protein
MAYLLAAGSTPNASSNAANAGIAIQTTGSDFICPVISKMDSSSSAHVSSTTVEQKSVIISGIDAVFDYTCANAAEDKALLNGFKVSGEGAGSDSSQNGPLSVIVDPAYKSGLVSLLAKAIRNAQDESTDAQGGKADAQAYLRDGLNADLSVLFNRLFNPQTTSTNVTVTDSLGNTANQVKGLVSIDSIAVELDASGGSENMWADLSNNPSEVEDIFVQIPEATLALYTDGSAAGNTDNLTTAALPLKHGDSLTFVFDVAAESPVFSYSTNVANINMGADAGIGSGVSINPTNSGAGGDYAASLSLSYTAPARRLAFRMYVSPGSGAVTGLKAAPAPQATQ